MALSETPFLLLFVLILQAGAVVLQQSHPRADIGNSSQHELVKRLQEAPSTFFMPVLCKDATHGSPVGRCQQSIMDFFARSDDTSCDNHQPIQSWGGCSAYNLPSDLSDSCVLYICGAPNGMPHDHNCQLLAVAAQEIISTCTVNGRVHGSVVLRQADATKDQTMVIAPTPTSLALNPFTGTSKRSLPIEEQKTSPPPLGNSQNLTSDHDVGSNKSLVARGAAIGVPFAPFSLVLGGMTGDTHMVIDQRTVDRQLARLLDDTDARPHSNRIHAAVPYTFDDTIDLDFQLRDGVTNDVFEDRDLQHIVQAINDQRNINNNPGVFAVLIYKGSDQKFEDYVGIGLWQWNTVPADNADAVPLRCQYCLPSPAIAAEIDQSVNRDPDTGEPYDYEYGPAPAYGPATVHSPIRVGNPRPFSVTGPGPNDRFTINSRPYPNGNGGRDLLNVNPNAGHYDVADPYNCEDAEITDDSDNRDSAWVTEHVSRPQLYGGNH